MKCIAPTTSLLFALLLLVAWSNSAEAGLINLALGKPVSQSSNGFGLFGDHATDGLVGPGSLTHTDTGDLAGSLTVDLGSDQTIYDIVTTNRIGCCNTFGAAERLYNISVQVLNSASVPVFTSPVFNSWNGVGGGAAVVDPGDTGRMDVFSAGGVTGRYVRVNKSGFGGSEWLSLSEVEVFNGRAGPNVALGKPTTTSSDPFGFPPGNAVDGNFLFPSMNHTNNGVEFLEVDLQGSFNLSRVEVINRNDGCCPERLDNALVSVLDAGHSPIGSALFVSGAGSGTKFVLDNGGAGFSGAAFVRIDGEGQYLHVMELRALQAIPVPEPSTAALLIVAAAAAGIVSLRRRAG